MTTWTGAIVETKDRADLTAVLARHRITLKGGPAPWTLVHGNVNLASLRPPAFAETLSRQLHATVVGFFLQSTASVEEIEHWEDGKLLRKLAYTGDGGGWVAREGTPQGWEGAYFFPAKTYAVDGSVWPPNLRDELTDDDLARYGHARASRDPSTIMDLLFGGSPDAIGRLIRYFGVDPSRPGAIYVPPTNWKPWAIAAAVVTVFLGAILSAVLTSR